MWGFLPIFGILTTYVNSQIIPEAEDYQNFPIPTFATVPNQMNSAIIRQSAITFGSCKIVYQPMCPDPDVSFYLYSKNHSEIPEYVRVGSDPNVSNLSATAYDPKKKTKIIIHGYNSDMFLTALTEIRKEYLKTRDYNIFTVDWSPLNQAPCYLGALINTRHVGACAAQLVQRIREYGAIDIHVIGFSLGAHITGFLANELRPYKLPRITGLDPALPGFITPNLDSKLDKTDAEFVDVYHTNVFMQGKAEESGHVDFYINGGVIQPGCWAERRFFACNHHRAPLYFAETINTKRGFWGWPCPSFFQYLLGNCPPREPQILMGDGISRSATGVYLVITESVSPFAVGKYEGPSIEIFLKMEKERRGILKKYQKEVMNFIDEEDLIKQVYKDKNLQQNLASDLADDLFVFPLNVTNIAKLLG